MCPVADDSDAGDLLEGVTNEQEREAREALLAELRAAGVPEDELRRAVAQNQLVLLPVERALSFGDERFTAEEVAERSGLELDFLERVNRALGRPRRPPDDRAYDAADVQAAMNVNLIRQSGIPDESILEVTRVLGQGMANLASTLAGAFGAAFLRAGDTEYDLSSRYGEESAQLMPLLEPGLGHALRTHLRAVMRQVAVGASERESGRLPGTVDTTVAFADLTGFTRLGESVPADELGALAERYGELVTDLVEPPVRLVKTIGDAAMLVSSDTDTLLDLLLELNDTAGTEASGLPAIHAGVAHGPALNRGGDVYGSAVNQASRIAEFARPASVVASDEVRKAAQGDYAWSFAGKRRLKGLAEQASLYRVRRPPPAEGET
jgi:adenylate cyclase